jgi:membrane-anchored protein YejM (alkaline phosphatase superfamily)
MPTTTDREHYLRDIETNLSAAFDSASEACCEADDAESYASRANSSASNAQEAIEEIQASIGALMESIKPQSDIENPVIILTGSLVNGYVARGPYKHDDATRNLRPTDCLIRLTPAT